MVAITDCLHELRFGVVNFYLIHSLFGLRGRVLLIVRTMQDE
jgi:hypothetical protein